MTINKYYISGFPPKNKDDCKVIIFDNTTFNSKDALRLADTTPNEDGVVTGELPDTWSGSEIQIVFISSQYVHENVSLKRENLGFYHTMFIRKETNSDLPLTHKWPVDPEQWYKSSQKLTMSEYRKAKFKNSFSKSIFWILTLGSPVIGLFLAGTLGVIAGLIITALVLWLGKYAAGEVKGI